MEYFSLTGPANERWLKLQQIAEEIRLDSFWMSSHFLQNAQLNYDAAGDQLSLVVHADGHSLQLQWDWGQMLRLFAKQKTALRQDPLARAVIPKKVQVSDLAQWTILDGTLGTGKDSLFFFHLGANVIAVERNPLIYLLAQHQYWALEKHWQNRFKIIYAFDLPSVIKEQTPDVFYFDPMYAQNDGERALQRKARPKKEMVIFDGLVGQDRDAGQVLQDVMRLNLEKELRIVVKRPVRGPSLLPQELANSSIVGKSVRFDLFLKKHST